MKTNGKSSQSIAIATVKENRFLIFEATSKPKIQKREIPIRNGKVIIQGKLGQPHKDLLESMRDTCIDSKYTADGRLALLIDPYKLRKTLGGEDGLYNYETMHRLIDDLIKTIIDVQTEDYRDKGTFLSRVIEAKKEVYHSKLGTPRKLMRVEFGALGTKLMEQDIQLFYNPKPIIKLQYGITKAVVRYILSHKNQPNGGWKLDTVIRAVIGENASSQNIRNARRRIKKDAQQLKECGILLKEERLYLIRLLDSIEFDPESVPQKPESVAHSPDSNPEKAESVPHSPESVPHSPESVPHSPESVPHSPEFLTI